MDIHIIKPTSERFSLEEAFNLMHQSVSAKNQDKHHITLDDVGVIQGVLDTDDEVEVIIRFIDGLKKFDKECFERELEIYVHGS